MISCKNKIVAAIAEFQTSRAYPAIFAALCAISGLCDMRVYIPILIILCALVLFSALFVNDNKVLLVPMLMIYYALGTDNKDTYDATNGDVFASIDPTAWNVIVVLAIIAVSVLIARFAIDGTFKSAARSAGRAFWGILLIDAALLTNGLFFPGWTVNNLLWGLLLAFFLTAFYLIFCSVIKSHDGQIIVYACKIAVLTSYIIFAQMIFKIISALATDTLVFFNEATNRWVLDRNQLSMSWGITTIVGGVLILGIPAALYLARNEKRPIIYSVSAILFAATPFIMNTRSSMLTGTILLFVGAIVVCVSGKNKRINLLFFSSLLATVTLAIIGVCIYLDSTGRLSYYLKELWLLARFDVLDDRLALLHIGEQHFLLSPAFGVGLLEGAAPEGLAFDNVFANMYHNIVVQFASSMGCVGIVAFIFHLKDFFAVGLKKPRSGRILLLLIPAAIILISLADNFFFYPNFMIFYAAFWALAEKDADITKERFS